MEFNEKLQELRKKKGITQEELAARLYVSRTAISKWESGRGYPNIDSLKAISKFFSVSVDELLSSDEVLTIAEEDGKQRKKSFCELIFGMLDVCSILLLILPLFAAKSDGSVRAVSLLGLDGVEAYLKILFFAVVFGTLILGIFMLALQNVGAEFLKKIVLKLSLAVSILGVLLFTVSLQPYAAVFSFVMLAVKVIMLIKR